MSAMISHFIPFLVCSSIIVMRLIHPLHLVEIQGLIANHLDTIDLLACVLVCKAWSNSFRRAL